jgi:transcription elongation factor GreA-like protein
VAQARTRAPSYDRSHAYGEGDFFIHPTFGVGQVKIVKPERMVVVLFEDGQERTMIHAR